MLSPTELIARNIQYGGRPWNRTRIARASAERLDHIGQTSVMEAPGVEPGTFSLKGNHSTSELRFHGAGEWNRTINQRITGALLYH